MILLTPNGTHKVQVVPSCAVALGRFDGVHVGHRKLLECAKKEAEEYGLAFAVWALSSPAKDRLINDKTKFSLLFQCGAEIIISENICDIRNMSAIQFVSQKLCGEYHAKIALCGENYRFGHGASADAGDLVSLMEKHGGRGVVIPCAKHNGIPVSSTYIRQLISSGRPEEAAKLLGRYFSFSSEVISGNHIGAKLGFPTVNQEFDSGIIMPARGVYLTFARVNDKFYPAVTNIGCRPTVESTGRILAETNILGFNGNLYGETIQIYLVSYLREETCFPSYEELKRALSNDTETARSLLQKHDYGALLK